MTGLESVVDHDNDDHSTRMLEDAASSAAAAPGFDSWRTPNSNNPVLVQIALTVGGEGITTGTINVDVDEDGGTTADYSWTLETATGLTGSITTDRSVTMFVPAGGSYQVRNTSDPTGNNAIINVREVTL